MWHEGEVGAKEVTPPFPSGRLRGEVWGEGCHVGGVCGISEEMV